MRITEKIDLDKEGLKLHGPITIVALGDSITHGSLAKDEINYETVFWNRLRKKINAYRSYVPVNVINAGIGATDAACALERLDKQVLRHEPDLVIVCFGLNDVFGEKDIFLEALRGIFKKCLAAGAQVIYMTPNMLNTYVADDTPTNLRKFAKITARMQENGGKMDEYMGSAIKLASDMGIEVCDCYSEWKRLALTEDVTMLLSNRLNHPTADMHELFADRLFNLIFKDKKEDISEAADTVIKLS